MYSQALLLLPALAFASPLVPRDTAPAPIITIVSAQTSGTGCPQGTVSTSLSTDSTVVTFGFDAFAAYFPGTGQADRSKACQIHLNLKYPGGFQYAVVESVYHGYARLDPGITGTFLSSYFFSQDASKTTTTRSSISGKDWLNGNVYTKEDQVPSTATIWSPCGANGILNVNNRIQLTGTGSGELSDDDATIRFTQQVHVSWQACTPGGSTGGGDWGTGNGAGSVTRDAEPQDDWGLGPGEVIVHPGDVKETEKREAQEFGVGPGDVIVTPGGGSTTPGDTWTIGPGGSVIITHPKE